MIDSTLAPTALIVGVGYLGQRLAQQWSHLPVFHRVFGTTRDPLRFPQLQQLGLEPIQWDVLNGNSALPAVSVVVYAVGFDRQSGQEMRTIYVTGLQRTLEHLPPPRQFIYISSTGIYGQETGAWVDEATPPAPTDYGGEVCLEAEQVLQEWAKHEATEIMILNLAGIYGPGRLLQAEQIKLGQPLAGDPDGWLNLIHGDDAARVVTAAHQRGKAGQRYLVADGQPVLRRHYYQYLAERLQAPAPTFDATRARRSRGNRRIRVDRMVQELQPILQFPNYQIGLDDCLARS